MRQAGIDTRNCFSRAMTSIRRPIAWLLATTVLGPLVGFVSAQDATKPTQDAKPTESTPSPPQKPKAAARPPASTTLPDRVQAVLETPGFANAHWGVLVVDSTTGETLFEKNADELFSTASVAKLFSTAAAMVDLGADHRFQTPVVRRGEVDDQGTLHGDLILIAQGDPAMGGRTGPDGRVLYSEEDHIYTSGGKASAVLIKCDPLAGLDHLAREIQAAGVKKITGEVIVDARLFDRAPSSGSGPSRVSPILINDNLLDVLVTPGESAGKPAAVAILPNTQYVAVDAQVETVADGDPQIRLKMVGPRRLQVRGRVPVGPEPLIDTIEVEDPATFARALFIEALRQRGVQTDASPLAENPEADLPPQSALVSLPKVAEYTSPPFREFARVILKVSHNLHASLLPMLLAARQGDQTLAAGLKRQGEILTELGMDPLAVSFGGGAGGMWADMVTPRAAVVLLRAMADRPDFSAYDAALPILGRDGTLAKAVAEDSPARGHAHAKTGTMFVTNALTGKRLLTSKSLAGYLETASGRQLTFAFFLNNVILDSKAEKPITTSDAGKVLGALCEAVYFDDDAPAPASETAAGGD